MDETISDYKKFRVGERSDGQRMKHKGEIHFLDCIWFELLEGDKSGLEFIIPIEHPEYDNNMEEKLASLNKDDLVSMSCRSTNENNTAWICEAISNIKSQN